MGNHFSADALGLDIYMTNSSTDVFCDVIALAGSSMTRTVWQQHLVLHFCDLERFRAGISGFDLAELPWTQDHQAEQDFFLVLLDRANRRTGWEKLHYTPSIDYNLGAFIQMLTRFRPTPTISSDFGNWTSAPKPYLLDRCLRHKVFRGEFGCRLCDTWTQPSDAPFVWEVTSTYTVDGTRNTEIIDRRIWQIPEGLIPRIFAIAGNPERRAVGISIEPQHLEAVSAIIQTPLDPQARHWLGKAMD
ncbi:hypothetical protein OHB26_37905 [Nocardia sp. NBC_01503]|uniref:hypothetical protein n=1 Tax=Nocardia sp. NBC_01503 TaxID=2975997 RepID=UPI002E7C3583|nr:hypothetical protein [Nocardia sp. NBC_01503]WTL32559.1 hypothetical protein OHB26_37905 [Nocardia sp. NBC_01503]